MATEKSIQNDLDTMGFEGLFLDKEWDSRFQMVLYTVKHVIDGSLYTALEWRDYAGVPLSLSDSLSGATLVETLRSQEGSLQEALRTALVNNAVKKELAAQKALAEAEETAREWDATKRAKKAISIGTGSIDHKTALNQRDL
jgi:hypothetical protein